MDDTTKLQPLDQTDEDILSYTVSDEALEDAARGTKRGASSLVPPISGCSCD